MKPGDMVEWDSRFWGFANKTVSPGIVLQTDDSHRQTVYTILWSCNTITTEHAGLVRRMGHDEG